MDFARDLFEPPGDFLEGRGVLCARSLLLAEGVELKREQGELLVDAVVEFTCDPPAFILLGIDEPSAHFKGCGLRSVAPGHVDRDAAQAERRSIVCLFDFSPGDEPAGRAGMIGRSVFELEITPAADGLINVSTYTGAIPWIHSLEDPVEGETLGGVCADAMPGDFVRPEFIP